MDPIFLTDVNDFANYEFSLEGILSFHQCSQIMEPNFIAPNPPDDQQDQLGFARYRHLLDEYEKKESKAFGIILNSLRNIPHIQRRVLDITPRVNGIRQGSLLLTNLKAIILADQDTVSLSTIEQKLDSIRLVSETEVELNTLLGSMSKYYSILEAHQAISEQAKILRLQKACSKFPKLNSFLAIVAVLPNTTFESVCTKLRAHILTAAACLHEEAQQSERTTEDLANASDAIKAEVNVMSYSPNSRNKYGSSRWYSSSSHRGHKHGHSHSTAFTRHDDHSSDEHADEDSDCASQHSYRSSHDAKRGRSPSPHRKYFDKNRYHHLSYRDRDRGQGHVHFKLPRLSTPPAGILKSNDIEVANPNIQCFKCRGYGHKANVCPSETKSQ